MEYINIPLYVIRSNEYIGADPTQRATWLSLIAWSCDQENMGRIAGARSWGDRRWMQSCGVMASEVAESCGLFRWDGDDLVISFYPADAQREIERKREIARANGRKGGRKPTPEPIPETNAGTYTGNQPWIANEASLESEKKGKEKKGNREGETTTVDSTPWEDVPPPPPVFSSPSRPRIADNHPAADPRAWQFIVACLQVNPVWSKTMPTAQEQGIALEAWESCKGSVTPKDIRLLQAYYASDLDSDRKGKPFWRPDSRSRFWEKFNDVLTHATRWAKETRWKPKTQQATKSKDEPTDAVSAENSLSIEEALKALHDPNWNPNENMHEKK